MRNSSSEFVGTFNIESFYGKQNMFSEHFSMKSRVARGDFPWSSQFLTANIQKNIMLPIPKKSTNSIYFFDLKAEFVGVRRKLALTGFCPSTFVFLNFVCQYFCVFGNGSSGTLNWRFAFMILTLWMAFNIAFFCPSTTTNTDVRCSQNLLQLATAYFG